MILAAMAVAAVTPRRRGRAEQARDARFPRLVAVILDTIFVGILTSIATSIYGVTEIVSTIYSGGGVGFSSTQDAIPAVWAGAIWLGYYAVCEGMFSATPGKALTRLRVVSADDSPLTLSQVVLRNLLRLVDVLPGAYVLGGLFVLGSHNSQRIGDLAARTTVVYSNEAREPGVARSSGLNARIALVCALIATLLFTAGFDYFQRPVLVIQSQYNTAGLGPPGITSYSLGRPTRTLDSVTYPIAARTATASCTGYVTLTWGGLIGWEFTGARLDCPPS
jgi:uncharacterized RDD family membrane protein YckC